MTCLFYHQESTQLINTIYCFIMFLICNPFWRGISDLRSLDWIDLTNILLARLSPDSLLNQ